MASQELAHPEPGFVIVGSKSYGRAPTFLMATGYEQVRSVVAEIAGDHAAAREVQLVLPETGVCSAPVAASTHWKRPPPAVAADPRRPRSMPAALPTPTPRPRAKRDAGAALRRATEPREHGSRRE